jgi:hypothetical protein
VTIGRGPSVGFRFGSPATSSRSQNLVAGGATLQKSRRRCSRCCSSSVALASVDVVGTVVTRFRCGSARRGRRSGSGACTAPDASKRPVALTAARCKKRACSKLEPPRRLLLIPGALSASSRTAALLDRAFAPRAERSGAAVSRPRHGTNGRAPARWTLSVSAQASHLAAADPSTSACRPDRRQLRVPTVLLLAAGRERSRR